MQRNKGTFDDDKSDQSSIDEYFLLKGDDAETRSFESHELSAFNSVASTPACQKKADFVTSTEITVIPGVFFTNPVVHKEEGDNIERLSDLEGSLDEIWKKTSEANSNNNNGTYNNIA